MMKSTKNIFFKNKALCSQAAGKSWNPSVSLSLHSAHPSKNRPYAIFWVDTDRLKFGNDSHYTEYYWGGFNNCFFNCIKLEIGHGAVFTRGLKHICAQPLEILLERRKLNQAFKYVVGYSYHFKRGKSSNISNICKYKWNEGCCFFLMHGSFISSFQSLLLDDLRWLEVHI